VPPPGEIRQQQRPASISHSDWQPASRH